MTSYTIAAIPTIYRGRRYRSRLEARWAAFFDFLGWAHEYEPFDLGEWSPDFLIRSSANGCELLVEVKPITKLDTEVARRMVRARHGRASGGGILLLAAQPWESGQALQLGWYGVLCAETPKATFLPALLGWAPNQTHPGLLPDIILRSQDFEGYWHTPITGFCGEEPYLFDFFYPGHAAHLWARASSEVQWAGKGGK